MLVIQILVVLFVLLTLGRLWGRFRRHTISPVELAVWTGFWFALAVVVLVPDITWTLARLLGVGRGVDAVLYLAIVGLSYAMFRQYLHIRRVEQQLTQLVRQLALAQAEKPR
jgi:hypothetical protein